MAAEGAPVVPANVRVLIPIANGSCEYQTSSIVTCLGKCGIKATLAAIDGDDNRLVEMLYTTVCMNAFCHVCLSLVSHTIYIPCFIIDASAHDFERGTETRMGCRRIAGR